jgi:hypothetical protein
MASQVILKKSSVAARVPVVEDLAFGELALNYADGILYYKKANGTTVASLGGSLATYTRTTFTTTAGQTVFTAAYTVGYVEVFYNGVLLHPTDYTATNGTSIILISAAVVNSIVEIIAHATTSISVITSLQITTALGFTPASRVRSSTISSSSTITPTSDTSDQYTITALAVPATIASPTGTPVDGQKLTIRIEDNGVARALTWTTTSGGYRIIGTTLPVTTVAGKTMYIGCIYNSNAVFWDVVSVAQEA